MSATADRIPRIGLVASRIHREPSGALLRLVAALEPALRGELPLDLAVVGQTFDAIADAGLLRDYPALRRLPSRREGGIIHLVAGIVDDSGADELDAVIYLLDPDDPTSVFPEGLALKRECVIHGKPFISTYAHAREWFELERIARGGRADPSLDRWFDIASQTVALVAHDARKPEMVAFAREHFDLLDRFARRIGTGTTGGLLNELAAARPPGAAPVRVPWVDRYRSGPLGGDAQIARDILLARCERVIFFEDPHVARQHEADIQLLERSARIRSDETMCVSDPVSAQRWAALVARRSGWSAKPR
ncbi:MAG TPA: methylglyoxal synthase [Burkholderiaceae bacterium]|nr:methylglyoxal synthase [Burkholderiaceae bacterium]